MLHELRVCFTPPDEADGRFGVQFTDAAGTACGVAGVFAPFLSEDDYENMRWYLEEFMDLPDGGAVVRARGIEQQLHEWGRRLYDALFAAPVNRALLDQLLKSPEPRELTIATNQSVLLRLPWELLADDAGNLAQRVSVRRQLPEREKYEARALPLPLRMLYIVSRPADTGFIDPRMTTKALFDALDPLGGNVRIDFCRPPTLARMVEMLRDRQAAGKPYHVVHFDGHGTFLPEAGIGALCFEKPGDGLGESQTDLVLADRLGNLLAEYQIPLVVLEACRSATVGKMSVFRSVAPRLIQSGIGSVLSMGHAVHVEAAKVLLDCFYHELANGTTIGHAVAQGRSALVSTNSRWIESGPRPRTIALDDWFLPHLYQRGADEPLLPRQQGGEEPPARKFDVFLSHQHNDGVRVAALADALSAKHRLRVWLDVRESKGGKLKPQCEVGIRGSRYTVVVGSKSQLNSKWVEWEIERHLELHPDGEHLLPVKFEPVTFDGDLEDYLWVDFTDPAKDPEGAALLAGIIRATDAADTQRLRGYRLPPAYGEPGAFPRPPQYQFQGRARELYELERHFYRCRGIVLHAMGGMGKTTLATEAARWWTRSGLFRDGACFVSFESTLLTVERIVGVLGEYCEGPRFHRHDAAEQRRRAVEYLHDKAVLMVWDNYESVLPAFHGDAAARESPYTDTHRAELGELFHDLTAGKGLGCILVTCRPGETGLPGAQRKELHGLARPDSLWLLHRILERDGLSLNDPRLTKSKLDPLLRDLADHPLSLELVGPHLRSLTPEEIRADFGRLLEKFKQTSDQSRNESLLASLEFSRRHLSPAARAALPWLGLFSGGVFEGNLLEMSQIDPAAWEPIRAELQGIALLRTEDDIKIGGRPFLRFHPTLAIASSDNARTGRPEIRQRFIDVYHSLMHTLDKALRGSQSRAALEVLTREEANYRTAVRWAVADQQHKHAAAMGDTFSLYLAMSGRLRERDGWVRWLRDVVTQAGFTKEAAAYEMEHALTLYSGGDPVKAVEMLEALVERLRHTTEFDPTFQLATAIATLGEVLVSCGRASAAIPFLREAVGIWYALVERIGGRPWEELLDTPDHVKATTELGNLEATMSRLSNALGAVGQLEEALAMSEKGVTIREKQGDHLNAAAGHGRTASLLMASGRFEEADARYDVALAAIRQAGDKGLEGMILQHQGSLARKQNQLDRANRLYQQALHRFEEAGNEGEKMRTYNHLGVIDQDAGRLAEARAWFEKSRLLAVQLKDQPCLGQAAQNIGIVCQLEGEAAREGGDEATARAHFQAALRHVEESLRIKQSYKNKPDESLALGQLARIYLLIGDLDAAERNAHAAREIREALNLTDVWKNYSLLAAIAEAREDETAAAEWAEKRDALLAELDRRAGGSGRLSVQMLKAFQQLAVACAQAGFGGTDLAPGAAEALATLDGFPAPMPGFSAHLRQFAAGQLPPIPASLPAELRAILHQLTKAIQAPDEGTT